MLPFIKYGIKYNGAVMQRHKAERLLPSNSYPITSHHLFYPFIATFKVVKH